ncbi:MAG: tetratricopeptide repeat protein [Burkholderiales bacterium]|nr:tetratricopeptide repeat protein [Burkholderiales bacterium]
MAVYDSHEQEQLDDLKAWWARWGNVVTTVVVIASAVAIGVQGWRWYTLRQADEAGVLYGALSAAVRDHDLPRAKDATTQLTDRYARTGYAPRGALLLAKALFDGGDAAGAKAQLTWVIDHGDETELKEIARYRLAEILLDEKRYDDALKVLDAKHGEPFAGLYADLRGDALAAAGKSADAKAAYETALAKLDAKSQYRRYVEVKLEALGGTLPGAAAAGAPGGGSGAAGVPASPAAAAAPAAAPAKP